ncbi:MAG: hypothetical protein QW367_03105 [Candidatus Aenigmatarchaeota archaeon]
MNNSKEMIRKAFIKRFKITKNKKILRRLAGINHNLIKKKRKNMAKKMIEWSRLALDYSQ